MAIIIQNTSHSSKNIKQQAIHFFFGACLDDRLSANLIGPMYLDVFLEAFNVSNVTILFLLSLGVGLLPKLGGAIGLELDLSFCWLELDWMILWGLEVVHLG